MYRFHWSLSEIETMIPFELEIYFTMLMDQITLENELKNANRT